MIKGIIFDYDGVIAESVQVKTDAFAKLYSPYGPKIVQKVVNYHLTHGGVSRFEKIKYFHRKYLNIIIDERELDILTKQFSRYVIDQVIRAPYVSGVKDFIKTSFKRYRLFISTGTPTEEIKQIIKQKKIDKYFSDVFGSPDKKTTHVIQIMQKYKFNSSDLQFFGDSSSDLEAAISTNIKFILVKNEFNISLFKNYSGESIDNFTDQELSKYS